MKEEVVIDEMLNISKDKFILMSILFCAFFQALNAGVNASFGYGTYPELEALYMLIIFFLTMLYVKAIGLKESESLDYGMNFLLFYPVLFPYAMIKQKKWIRGIVFIVLWYIVMNISYYSWVVVDVFVEIPSYE